MDRHQEQERHGGEQERGRRVVDADRVRHAIEQVGERRQHEQHQADGQPQQRELALEAVLADEPDDESDRAERDDDDEDVGGRGHAALPSPCDAAVPGPTWGSTSGSSVGRRRLALANMVTRTRT